MYAPDGAHVAVSGDGRVRNTSERHLIALGRDETALVAAAVAEGTVDAGLNRLHDAIAITTELANEQDGIDDALSAHLTAVPCGLDHCRSFLDRCGRSIGLLT